MGNGRICVLPQHLHLRAIEHRHLIRADPPDRQDMGWIWLYDRQIGKVDIFKAPLLHRPKHLPPRRIERRDIYIAIRQPNTQSITRPSAIGNRRVLASEFIVRLPSCNVWICPIPFRQQGHISHAFRFVRCAAIAILPARSEPARTPPDHCRPADRDGGPASNGAASLSEWPERLSVPLTLVSRWHEPTSPNEAIIA